jgi:hypothetical protein
MHNAHSERKSRQLYLFNDMVLVTKSEGDKYKLLNMCSFDSFVEPYISLTEPFCKIEEFKIFIFYAPKCMLTVYFENQNVKDNWAKSLKQSISDWVSQKNRIVQASKHLVKDMNFKKNSVGSLSSSRKSKNGSTSSLAEQAEPRTSNLSITSKPGSGEIRQDRPKSGISDNELFTQRQSQSRGMDATHMPSLSLVERQASIKRVIEQHQRRSQLKKEILDLSSMPPLPTLEQQQRATPSSIKVYNSVGTSRTNSILKNDQSHILARRSLLDQSRMSQKVVSHESINSTICRSETNDNAPDTNMTERETIESSHTPSITHLPLPPKKYNELM